MDDDRKPSESSEDLLRAAREDAASASHTQPGNRDDESEPRRAPSELMKDPQGARYPSADRLVTAPVRFVATGDAFELLRASWYVIVVDGVEVAKMHTKFERAPARGFYSLRSMRFTTVNFPDQPQMQWHIGAEEPGPRPTKTKRSGEKKELLFGASDRRVYVDEKLRITEGYKVTAEHRRLAQTEMPIATGIVSRFSSTTTVSSKGRGYALRRSIGLTRRGSIGELAEFAHAFPVRHAPWSVDVKGATPLSVIVLGWHLVAGDVRMESNG